MIGRACITMAVVALGVILPRPGSAQTSAAPGSLNRPVAVQAFAQLSRISFTSDRSFNAVNGSSARTLFGGGGRLVLTRGALRKLFFEGSVDRFRRTGEQMFVFEGEVFPLGVANELTITPIQATAGYRVGPVGGRFAPYRGFGVGSYGIRASSEFATSSEHVRMRLTGYHVTGGVDLGLSRFFGVGADVRWSSVSASDVAGVFQEFGEDDLGGTSIGVRLLVGF